MSENTTANTTQNVTENVIKNQPDPTSSTAAPEQTAAPPESPPSTNPPPAAIAMSSALGRVKLFSRVGTNCARKPDKPGRTGRSERRFLQKEAIFVPLPYLLLKPAVALRPARKGSTVLFEWAVVSRTAAALVFASKPIKATTGMIPTRNTVAVVDDDESYARALERRLRASGFDVSTYPSAEALLSTAGVVRKPDCFVLDIQLGGMTGLELFRRLREVGSTVPVIFVTAHDAPGVREEATRAGCAGYFSKPVPGAQLVDAIHEAIHAASATHPM